MTGVVRRHILRVTMSSDDLKSRIEALNKRPLQNVAPAEQPAELDGLRRKLRKQAEAKSRPAAEPAATRGASSEPVVYSRTTPRAYARAYAGVECPFDGDKVVLEEVINGVTSTAPVGPGYYHIEQYAVYVDECALEVHADFLPVIGHPDGTAVERICALCQEERLAPKEMMFMDIETTGLSSTPVFLIGTMECDEEGFLFRQYFARDYSEETSILSAFGQRLADARMLVTFNGKSFDMPYLENRAVACAVKLPRPKHHLDLLHEARRYYGRSTPNHKLQTLEQIVCGRCREDDIPGAQIPAAYHEFVRTNDARKIGLILQHNLYDLLTMADLMARMWGSKAT